MSDPLTPRLAQLFAFLEADPTDAFTLYSIAYEYSQAGQWQLAIERYRTLLAQHPGYVAAYYHLGKAQEAAGDAAGAESTYRSGIEAARAARERHALAELMEALNALE